MKILKQVDASAWTHKISCEGCDSELQADVTDIRYKHVTGDQRDPSYDSYQIECPICHICLDIFEESIPKTVRIQAKNKAYVSSLSSSYQDR